MGTFTFTFTLSLGEAGGWVERVVHCPAAMQTTHQEQPYDVVSLASARVPANQNQPGRDQSLTPARVNVHNLERIASTMLGTYLLGRWKFKSQQSSRLLAMLGSALLYRGVSGHCHLYGVLGVSTAQPRRLA